MASSQLTVGGLLLHDPPTFVLSTYDEREHTAPRRSNPVTVPGVRGSDFGTVVEGPRVDRYRLGVFGDYDLAGAATSGDSHDQLLLNLAAVRRAIRQRHDQDATATFVASGVTFTADVLAELSGTGSGPAYYLGDLTLTVPAGLWQAQTAVTSTSASSAATRTLDVDASTAAGDSTLDLFDAVITLTGAATTVRIEQGDRWLQFNDTLGGGVTLDCSDLSATRDGSPVHGLVTRDGGHGWMPIGAEGSTLNIVPTGGAVEVDVAVRPAW